MSVEVAGVRAYQQMRAQLSITPLQQAAGRLVVGMLIGRVHFADPCQRSSPCHEYR